uniref:Uncharacterized protein n=1 Tax=Sphaeramia orbicularis TaxID=375764 RepID=A0A673B833_9TELE
LRPSPTSFPLNKDERRLVMTRSEKESKGRGPRQYRTSSCSRSRSRDCFWCSETPPYWRQEMQQRRMRAVTGEHWIKDDRGVMNEHKDEATRRKRRFFKTKRKHSAEGKRQENKVS